MNSALRARVAGVCFLFLAGCSRQDLPATGQGPGAPGFFSPRGDAISTFTLVGHNEAGRRKWEVRGETADLMADVVELSPVRATSFGQVQLNLSAAKGRFNKSTRDIHLEGDVVAVTSDGAKLTTQSMDWVQEREEGRSEDWVRVSRPGMTATGLGGVGYPKLKRVRLERKVTVRLQDAKGRTRITCDGPMEVDYARHKARFWRNVWVRDGKGVIRADRMDVSLHPKTNQIEKATFWGHVRIRQGKQRAFANRVNYWQPLGHIQLVGHPKLVLMPEQYE